MSEKGSYRILWDYGAYEGMTVGDCEYEDAETALKDAMLDARCPFKIVKVIEFSSNGIEGEGEKQ